jgi:hypothetical protein
LVFGFQPNVFLVEILDSLVGASGHPDARALIHAFSQKCANFWQ